MQLSGHDIRMKEFRRAILRGYSEADVDTFLMHLAVEIDQRDRVHHLNGTTQPNNGAQTPSGAGINNPASDERDLQATVPASPISEGSNAATRSQADTSMAAIVATDIVQQARTTAQEIHAQAAANAAAIERDAQDAGQDIVDEARAKAERGLNKARERAEEMLEFAREDQDRASRTDAEARLRLAHVEQQLAERQLALAEEARRLDELPGWMAEQDLQPETDTHRPAHAAPEQGHVVELKAAAE